MSQNSKLLRFGLSNFKSFHYLEDIELRPLTVLVGANSAGKSSLLQSLLLLKQTLEADRFSGVLKFDGEWTHLGSYANVISDFDTTRKLEYRFSIQQELSLPNDLTQAREALNYRLPGIEISDERLQKLLTLESNITIRFDIQHDKGTTRVEEFTINSKISDLMVDNQAGVFSVFDNGTRIKSAHVDLQVFSGPTSMPVGVEFDKFWPKAIVYQLVQPANAEVGVSTRRTLPLYIFPNIGGSLQYLEECLTGQLEYLGPIRADPRPFYPVEETNDVGTRGESTVPYLLRHQNDTIKYVPSPMGDVQETTLLDATNHWLRAMKVTDCLSINPVESIAYVAAIQSRSASTKSVNLSQVGFGIGQVLPVLVAGLKGPNDSTLLLEQPEIHLHPRLQAMLAEFLICTVQGGKTVVVETHSDHLINRLRRCIAEDKTGALADMVSILFVHPGTQDNPSSFIEELKIDETGNIINWPPDFLSETANESLAILRAGQQKAVAARP